MIANLGYGSVLLYSRPKHAEATTKLYQQNPREAIQKELDKMQTDNKSYATIKRIWAVLTIVCAVAFFFVNTDYLKGLSLGLLCLFVGFLLLDSLLHHRLKPYLETLASSAQA